MSTQFCLQELMLVQVAQLLELFWLQSIFTYQ
jgi:hypothetical protein